MGSGNFDNKRERDFLFFIGLGCRNLKGKVAGYGNLVLSCRHFFYFGK